MKLPAIQNELPRYKRRVLFQGASKYQIFVLGVQPLKRLVLTCGVYNNRLKPLGTRSIQIWNEFLEQLKEIFSSKMHASEMGKHRESGFEVPSHLNSERLS